MAYLTGRGVCEYLDSIAIVEPVHPAGVALSDLTSYTKGNNVSTFSFETPFTKVNQCFPVDIDTPPCKNVLYIIYTLRYEVSYMEGCVYISTVRYALCVYIWRILQEAMCLFVYWKRWR